MWYRDTLILSAYAKIKFFKGVRNNGSKKNY